MHAERKIWEREKLESPPLAVSCCCFRDFLADIKFFLLPQLYRKKKGEGKKKRKRKKEREREKERKRRIYCTLNCFLFASFFLSSAVVTEKMHGRYFLYKLFLVRTAFFS